MRIITTKSTKSLRDHVMPDRRSALSKQNIAFIYTFTSFLIVLFFLSGCAGSGKQVKKQRYFFPPPPDQPRIEWINKYSSQNDFPKTAFQRFIEGVVGQDPPRTFGKPWGVASDGEGVFYVADTQGSTVIVYDTNNKTVLELGGEQLSGLFKRPIDVDLDASGNIYVSDSDKKRVFVFTKAQNPLITIGDDNMFKWPAGIGVDRKLNRLYVVDTHLCNVSVFETGTGKFLFSFGKRGAGDGELNFPTDVAVDSKGNIYVTDTMNARVHVFDQEGKYIRKFGHRGDGATDFKLVKGIAISRDDYVMLTDPMASRFQVFSTEGQALLTIGVRSGGGVIGGFNIPQGVYVDKNDQLFVVDSLNVKVEMFQIINEEWLKKNPIEK